MSLSHKENDDWRALLGLCKLVKICQSKRTTDPESCSPIDYRLILLQEGEGGQGRGKELLKREQWKPERAFGPVLGLWSEKSLEDHERWLVCFLRSLAGCIFSPHASGV